MKRLIIPSTIYNLFIYILLDKDWKKRIYMLKLKNFNNKFLKNFNNYNLKIIYFEGIKFDKNEIWRTILYYLYYIFNVFKCVIYMYYQNIKIIYGADHIFPLLFKLKSSYLIEDGLLNYKPPKNRNTLKKKIIDFFLLRPLNYKCCGYEENIKKIYLTGITFIPDKIKEKVEIINLKELWKKKKLEEKKEILAIFGFNDVVLNSIKNKKYILFTQALSEDGFMLEEEKIILYKRIISNYNEDLLVLKTHPREKTNYKKFFPKIEILDQIFPAELFELLDIKFEKVITIYSTTVLNFSNDIEIDFYGTEVNDKLLKSLGSYDHLIKRNKVLK